MRATDNFPMRNHERDYMAMLFFFDEFKTIKIYDEKDLGKSTRKHLNPILKHNKGGGYFIWKPITIKTKLDSIKDGDFLIYIDGGASLNKLGKSKLWEYLTMASESPFGTLCFGTGIPENQVTKKEVFEYYGVERNNNKIRNSIQYGAGHLIMQKNQN